MFAPYTWHGHPSHPFPLSIGNMATTTPAPSWKCSRTCFSKLNSFPSFEVSSSPLVRQPWTFFLTNPIFLIFPIAKISPLVWDQKKKRGLSMSLFVYCPNNTILQFVFSFFRVRGRKEEGLQEDGVPYLLVGYPQNPNRCPLHHLPHGLQPHLFLILLCHLQKTPPSTGLVFSTYFLSFFISLIGW